MPTPREHKTVQARILAYAQEVGWTVVTREEAERKRSADIPVRFEDGNGDADRSVRAPFSLFFNDLLDAKVREFNSRYKESKGVLLGQLRLLHADIFGNREFVEMLRNRGTFFDQEEKRERDLMLIDYDDPSRNVYEVTEEWTYHNGHYGTREDVVFLINGIPVLVIECKNADGEEGIALGVDQIRRYHRETPELFVPEQLFAATDAIGFSYGVTWNLVRRNIFDWKVGVEPQKAQKAQNLSSVEEGGGQPLISLMGTDEDALVGEEKPRISRMHTDAGVSENHQCESASSVIESLGRLEAKVKSFCAIPQVLAFLKDYIVFAEKDEELNKYILRQHQTGAVEAAVGRALRSERTRGLIWHTQGSGKTFTMIKTAERLFKAPEADKPTVLLMIDRNELEDQMLKNLAALGLGNLEHAHSISRLNQLLREDYRGIIVSMIHKFRDMPAGINTRSNIFVLIDEAHRTTGGDLGTFLMAGLPNATFLGFTGTPIDKTAYGRGTFKTFGCEDDQGYLHKYSIAESIEDGTTLPLYYQLAPNEILVPHETLDKEFLSLAETEGLSDIEELNKILERAVNLKNFLKGEARIRTVARFVAEHYRENVEPLGYKAFLVGVDREACALYKHALDEVLPSEYSEVVYTGNNNDSELLKKFHLDPKKERQIRKSFGKLDQQPKILIVTEKLLTGFDAPVLYAMYLDKPMRDHTLLQAIARVNRPYENEAREMVKPHGFVLDFVGIFDKLEKALAFDSDEVNAIVKDLKLLKLLFRNKMERKAPGYLSLIDRDFNDKDVDGLIEYFRDPERRKEFFKEYKELEMLYEIISPDAFLRPYLDDYGVLSAIYDVVRKAYTKRLMVDRDFQRKTEKLVREHVGGDYDPSRTGDTYAIDGHTIELVKADKVGKGTKVINLVKSIEKKARDESDDPILVGMAERARKIQEGFEQRQQSTEQALEALFALIQKDEARRKAQAEKGFDALAYFVYRQLEEAGVGNAEAATRKIGEEFKTFSNWRQSEAMYRELRQGVTFALVAELDDVEQVTAIVENLFRALEKEL